MKKNIIIFLLLVTSVNLFAVDTTFVKSKITDVTVFFNGAQITRNAEIKLSKGKHIIIFDELPQELYPASIQISTNEKCKILSVKHQLKNQSSFLKGQTEKDIDAKIKQIEQKIKEIKNKIRAFDLEEKLLIDNSNFSKKDNGSTMKDVKEAADYYRLRLNEIMQGRLLLFKEAEDLNKQLTETYKSLNEIISKKQKIFSQILVSVECEGIVNQNFKASYYVPSASWIPSYDFRVEDISKPLVIVYNADVSQTSGESWENVNITLSTNNPSLSGNKPDLVPWQVGTNPYQQINTQKSTLTVLKGKVTEKDNVSAVPFANIILYQGDKQITGTTTDFDGMYTFKSIPSGQYTIKATFVGFKSYEIRNLYIAPNRENYHNINLEPNMNLLEEVVVTEYKVPLIDKGKTTSGETISSSEIKKFNSKSYDWTPTQPKSEVTTTDYISNSLKTGVANLEYAIEIPYTIQSDGENYAIKIKESSMPVTYLYHSVPKLEKDVFLSAEIIDWNALNLLSGKINIYYQGTYTGESYIDANNASDTLSVSLGRDKGILIQRDGNKEMFDKKIIGNNIKETLAWDITIKNNKDSKIKIIIEDQYPLSYRKTVEVELLNSLGAKIDEKTGKLTWEIELNPNEKKVLNFKYSVKYPKYTNLMIE